MLRRLLTLLTVLTLACASAQAYVPERTLLQAGELASPAKTAPRGFAARAEPAAKEKSGASDCCVRENWHPPLKLASSMQFTGHYREREGSDYYAQQRYYRPGLGRFNRIDPWAGDEANPITLNKYLYANGNPLYYTDPTGMYAEAGHYYTVLLAAKEAGYSTADSLRIALYAQLPDEIPRFDAINQATSAGIGSGSTQYVLVASGKRPYANSRNTGDSLRSVRREFTMDDVQGAIHNLLGEDSAVATERSRAALVNARSTASAGIAAHALGDSFSHRVIGGERSLYPKRLGHLVDGGEPDQIAARTELYGDYVRTLVKALGDRNGGVVSDEQADAFARSMVDTANSAKGAAPPSFMNAATSGVPDGDRVEMLAAQEAAILKAIHDRASVLIAEEGREGEVLLRPERSHVKAMESVLTDQQPNLDRFYRRAMPDNSRISTSVYSQDVNVQRLSNAVLDHIEEMKK